METLRNGRFGSLAASLLLDYAKACPSSSLLASKPKRPVRRARNAPKGLYPVKTFPDRVDGRSRSTSPREDPGHSTPECRPAGRQALRWGTSRRLADGIPDCHRPLASRPTVPGPGCVRSASPTGSWSPTDEGDEAGMGPPPDTGPFRTASATRGAVRPPTVPTFRACAGPTSIELGPAPNHAPPCGGPWFRQPVGRVCSAGGQSHRGLAPPNLISRGAAGIESSSRQFGTSSAVHSPAAA